jgi:hypothetical protein
VPAWIRLVASVGLFCYALAQAQQPKPAQKAARTQTAYLTKPLALSVESVGSGFKGHDIAAVITELKRSPANAPKSEFETTQQYEQRVKILLESKNRQYVFVLDDYAASGTYDADKEVMDMVVTAPSEIGLFDSDTHMVNEPADSTRYWSSSIELRSVVRSRTQYVGTSGLGAKATVTHITYDQYGIVLSTDDLMFSDTNGIGTRVSHSILEMNVQTAKSLKPFLRVALVCTLTTPTIYKELTGVLQRLLLHLKQLPRDNTCLCIPTKSGCTTGEQDTCLESSFRLDDLQSTFRVNKWRAFCPSLLKSHESLD